MIMVNIINTDDVFFVNRSQTTGIKKIDPVREVNSLPDHGKDLPVTEKKAQAREEDIDQAVDELNQNSQVVQRELHFAIDKDSGHTVIKVVDSKTEEVIRQIPGEEVLRVARRLNEGSNLEIFNSYT